MKIGLLIDSTAWGGAEIHAAGLTRVLRGRSHDATLVALTHPAHEVYRPHLEPDFPLDCLGVPLPMRSVGYFGWRRLFANRDWDVCMLIKGDLYAGGGSAIDFAARSRFARYLVLEQKDVDPMPPRRTRRRFGVLPGLGLWWYREQVRRRLRSVAPCRIVCVSEANRQRLVRDHGFPARKMDTVRNGADIARFRRDPQLGAECRRRWGVPDDALVFGAIGRFHRIKGYATALDAFPAVLRARPDANARLVLVGEGPEEDALRAQAERLGLSGSVVFVPFSRRPWEALSALDIFVMPSYAEGLPLALAEAMACECCPIATPVGGIPEAVSGPDLGWLVPPADVGRFADAMIDAAGRSDEERRAMGRRARAHAEEHFDSAVQFVRLAEIIESLAPAETRGRSGELVGGGSVNA